MSAAWGIAGDVRLSDGRDVAGHGDRASHDDDVSHEIGQPRLQRKCQREVGQAPHRQQGDLARVSAHGVDDELSGAHADGLA